MWYHHQDNLYSCGPASLRMVLDHFRIKKSCNWLMNELRTNKRSGTKRGMFGVVCDELDLDFIVHRNSSFSTIKNFLKKGYCVIVAYVPPKEKFYHYAVVGKIDSYIHLFDPWYGPDFRFSLPKFNELWHDDENNHWLIAIKRPNV